MKKLFVLLLIAMCLGCCNSNQEKTYLFSSFNDMTFVWENFNFSTNRVMK